MKKFFTLIASVLLAGSMNAAVLVDNVETGAQFTYAGGWNGTWFNQDGTAEMDKDVSQYDYVWIQYANATGKMNFGIVYSEWLKTVEWGESYYTDTKTIDTESGVVGIALEKTKTYEKGVGGVDNDFKGEIYAKHVQQVYLQDQGVASTITVVGIWYGTEAEYQEALAGNAPVIAPRKDLDLSNLNSGWGEGTDYNAETKTITIGDDWSGKGWWLAQWDGTGNVGTDYSAYDKVVIRFAEPTVAGGNCNTQYDANVVEGATDGSVSFEAGTTLIVYDLDEIGKKAINQIYIQGPSGATYVIEEAYFCTNEIAPEVPTAPMGAPIAIWEGSNDFGLEWSWDNTFVIAADKFAGAAEGSFLEFFFTEDTENAQWWQYQLGAEGLDTYLTSNKSDLNEYDCATMTNGATSYKVRLNADDAALLAANGLRVAGYALTTTKVTLTNPLALEVWTVAGGSNLMGSDWDTTDTGNDLTSTDGKLYTLVKKDVTLEKGVTYEFKVAKDHGWAEAYPASNAQLTVAETGVYTVTFTFNAETKDVTTNAVKTGDAGVIEKVYSVIGTLNGNWDADSNLTKDADGLYKVTIANVAAGSYEFKIRVNADWGENYGADGVPGGNNIAVTVSEDASAVVVTFDADSKAITVTVLTGADGIKGVKAAANNGAAYNLGGRQVKAGKGLYIQNGKKYMAK